MKIKIICFNKVDKEFKDAIKYYSDKVSKLCNFEVIELNEISTINQTKNMIENMKVLNQRLNTLIENRFQPIVLDVNSKVIDSIELKNIIEHNKDVGTGNLVFIVGPSDGFSEEFKQNNYTKISFGKITLPHILFRVVLFEQIYRSFKIMNNDKYHK
ncbi:23S rRNA (pseudouridine1915-N3)-methyltransferase [Spiroplasma sp. TIUS-1]|uniref:23S rRNA (pseudouridine(1915)-N(3))-methyltransferase RlmH n=1 Tax=Spiroplasma sp. TIUS-1 TaxID=216963 RepID=UPI00139777DD|nr:23S rRNA (pseudouridine(1915)-N(3))-methyltransferase RlmH [Spiroplasma sp. TIUS-1]QHX35833.1 23S rRNA (pseudouridine1915-N3)-methyltransferase [Spiroplasma sp. TIUS-1]